MVAGALFDGDGRVLIAQRPADRMHAGRWEFPGGKIIDGETEAVALARELREELGVEIHRHCALMQLTHDYPERRVELHLHVVESFGGEPRALDGQQFKWVPLDALHHEDLLEADIPFVQALQRRGAPAR